jgi:hypothetical protein
VVDLIVLGVGHRLDGGGDSAGGSASNAAVSIRRAFTNNVINIVFLLVAALLVARFLTLGGLPMLRSMGGVPDDDGDVGHHEHGRDQPRDRSSAQNVRQVEVLTSS